MQKAAVQTHLPSSPSTSRNSTCKQSPRFELNWRKSKGKCRQPGQWTNNVVYLRLSQKKVRITCRLVNQKHSLNWCIERRQAAVDAHLPSTVINHKKLRMWAISALEGSIHEDMLIDTLTDIMNRLYSQLETLVPKRHVERVSMYQTMCEADPLKRQLNAYVASTQEQTVFSICLIFYWKSRFKKYMW